MRLKLPQKSQIILKKQAQIIDAKFQHRHTLNAKAKGKTGILLRVDSDMVKNFRINHAAAHDLEPAGPLAHAATSAATKHAAHVDFCRGLRERKKTRTETQIEIGRKKFF